jgi:mannose-6-phosphate isomerase-like protein (cupin superfamily)
MGISISLTTRSSETGRMVTHGDIDEGLFRQILHTTPRSQIGTMVLPAGYTLKREKHMDADQYFFIVSGNVVITVESPKEKYTKGLTAGDWIMVDGGDYHELSAIMTTKLYTIYAGKPQHPEGTKEKDVE